MSMVKSLFTSRQPEIEQAQRDLYMRRQVVIARKRLLRSETQHKLANPKALLIAAGSGFLLEKVSRKPRCKRCGKATLGLDIGNLLRIMVRAVTLTHTVQSISDTLSGHE